MSPGRHIDAMGGSVFHHKDIAAGVVGQNGLSGDHHGIGDSVSIEGDGGEHARIESSAGWRIQFHLIELRLKICGGRDGGDGGIKIRISCADTHMGRIAKRELWQQRFRDLCDDLAIPILRDSGKGIGRCGIAADLRIQRGDGPRNGGRTVPLATVSCSGRMLS